MLGSLKNLASSLAGLGILLQWRRENPVEEVVRAAHDWKADFVYWNRDYEPGAIRRDHWFISNWRKLGVAVRTFKDHVVFEAEEVRSATGEPLQRYSAYRARWWTKWQATKADRATGSEGDQTHETDLIAIHLHPSFGKDLGYDPLTPWIEPGERSAHERLQQFSRWSHPPI